MKRLYPCGTCDGPGCRKEGARVVISVFWDNTSNVGASRVRFCSLVHAEAWLHNLTHNNEKQDTKGTPAGLNKNVEQ